MATLKVEAVAASKSMLRRSYELIEMSAPYPPIMDGRVPDPIDDCLRWLLAEDLLDCIVIAPERRVFRSNDWPMVIVSKADVADNLDVLEKSINAGFSSVIGTKCNLIALRDSFLRFGLTVDGQTRLGSGDAHDPLASSWNPQLIQGIAVAERLCKQALCIFAHDGSPVYILEAVPERSIRD
jgi:hypothetical protein